jgi:hypothetical protein
MHNNSCAALRGEVQQVRSHPLFYYWHSLKLILLRGDAFSAVEASCPALILSPSDAGPTILGSNLQVHYRIKQLFPIGDAEQNCTYAPVCRDKDVVEAPRCIAEVEEMMKLRIVTTDSSSPIPHYERDSATVPTYASKFRTTRLHTKHTVHVRTTLVLELYAGDDSLSLTTRLTNTIKNATSSMIAFTPPPLYDTDVKFVVGIFLFGGGDKIIKLTDYVEPAAANAAAASLQGIIASNAHSATSLYGGMIDALDFVTAGQFLSSFAGSPSDCALHKADLYNYVVVVSDFLEVSNKRSKTELLQSLRSSPASIKMLFVDTYDKTGQPDSRKRAHVQLLEELVGVGDPSKVLSPSPAPTVFAEPDGCSAPCTGTSADLSCYCDHRCFGCYSDKGVYNVSCAREAQCCGDFGSQCPVSSMGTAAPSAAPTPSPTHLLGYRAINRTHVVARADGGTINVAMARISEWTKINMVAKQRVQAIDAPTGLLACTSSTAPSQDMCVSGVDMNTTDKGALIYPTAAPTPAPTAAPTASRRLADMNSRRLEDMNSRRLADPSKAPTSAPTTPFPTGAPTAIPTASTCRSTFSELCWTYGSTFYDRPTSCLAGHSVMQNMTDPVALQCQTDFQAPRAVDTTVGLYGHDGYQCTGNAAANWLTAGVMVWTANPQSGLRNNMTWPSLPVDVCAPVGFDATNAMNDSSDRTWRADDVGHAGWDTPMPSRQFVVNTGADRDWLIMSVKRKDMRRGGAVAPDFRVSIVKMRSASDAPSDARERANQHDSASYGYQGDDSKRWQVLKATGEVAGFGLEKSSVYVATVMPLVRADSASGMIEEVGGFELNMGLSLVVGGKVIFELNLADATFTSAERTMYKRAIANSLTDSGTHIGVDIIATAASSSTRLTVTINAETLSSAEVVGDLISSSDYLDSKLANELKQEGLDPSGLSLDASSIEVYASSSSRARKPTGGNRKVSDVRQSPPSLHPSRATLRTWPLATYSTNLHTKLISRRHQHSFSFVL